jgi:DNA-binding NarL/FixJ family response regulator
MRCLVIDDDAHDRELVMRMVEKAGHESMPAANADTALELARGERFDIALVDLSMPGIDGVATLRMLRKQSPDLRLLVVSSYDDRDHVLGAVGAGADGYVLKTELGRRLSGAIDEVSDGGGPMSAKIAHYILEELRHPGGLEHSDLAGGAAEATLEPEGEAEPKESKDEYALSKREWDVINQLSDGKTYAQIGKALDISVNTVRHHIRNLYSKLDVTGKAAAVERARVAREKMLGGEPPADPPVTPTATTDGAEADKPAE